jgi:hypothetical protein
MVSDIPAGDGKRETGKLLTFFYSVPQNDSYDDVFNSQRDQILCMTLLSVIHMTTYVASMIGRSCVLTSQ